MDALLGFVRANPVIWMKPHRTGNPSCQQTAKTPSKKKKVIMFFILSAFAGRDGGKSCFCFEMQGVFGYVTF